MPGVSRSRCVVNSRAHVPETVVSSGCAPRQMECGEVEQFHPRSGAARVFQFAPALDDVALRRQPIAQRDGKRLHRIMQTHAYVSRGGIDCGGQPVRRRSPRPSIHRDLVPRVAQTHIPNGHLRRLARRQGDRQRCKLDLERNLVKRHVAEGHSSSGCVCVSKLAVVSVRSQDTWPLSRSVSPAPARSAPRTRDGTRRPWASTWNA